MPKLNVDEIKQLAEPIEVTIDGKDYKIEKLSTDLMNRATEEKTDPNKQLAILLGTDTGEFMAVDIRKVGKALEFITQVIKEGLERKNAPEA